MYKNSRTDFSLIGRLDKPFSYHEAIDRNFAQKISRSIGGGDKMLDRELPSDTRRRGYFRMAATAIVATLTLPWAYNSLTESERLCVTPETGSTDFETGINAVELFRNEGESIADVRVITDPITYRDEGVEAPYRVCIDSPTGTLGKIASVSSLFPRNASVS